MNIEVTEAEGLEIVTAMRAKAARMRGEPNGYMYAREHAERCDALAEKFDVAFGITASLEGV